jgi:hypothetical protein
MRTLRRTARLIAATIGATALAALLVTGAASAANAETPPESQPAQEQPDSSWGPTGSWGGGSWVGDSFSFVSDDGFGGQVWEYTGGGSPSLGVNADFARNLDYTGGCFGNYGSTQVVCYD